MSYKISDYEFQYLTSLINKEFFKSKSSIKKINIYLENRILINIKYSNLAHLLGVQYYSKIIDIKNNKRKDLFNWFIYNFSNKKILFSTLYKKISSNWNKLKKLKEFEKFNSWKDVLSCLVSKLFCFIEFINKFLIKKEEINLSYFKNKDFSIEYFFVFKKQPKEMYLLGTKKISNIAYSFETHIPMSFQIWEVKKISKFELSKIIIENIKIECN